MPKEVALVICAAFILWLFARDGKLRPMSSWELWIPLLWIVIVGTRSVSYWFEAGVEVRRLEDYLEGSPLDAAIFFILIVMGFFVLWRRKLDWSELISSNRWFFAFIIYCGMSVMWSDYPLTAFKRYIKDIGNVVMTVIIITEEDSAEATKAIFSRYAYLVIPLSALFVMYYPEIGRYYNRWTGNVGYCGIAQDKNALGALAMISGIFLIWDFVETYFSDDKRMDKADLFCRIALMLMVFWLLSIAQSSTSLFCLIIGVGLFLLLRFTADRGYVRYLGTYSLIAGCLIVFLYLDESILGAFTEMLGREPTLTGRVDMWERSISRVTNPLIGAGFESFWITDHSALKDRSDNLYFLNQAHNGYLETYLQLGLVGVCLLVAVIITTGVKLKWDIYNGHTRAAFFFSLFVVALVYNWTEATFNKLNLIWMVTIICALNYSYSPRSTSEEMVRYEMDAK